MRANGRIPPSVIDNSSRRTSVGSTVKILPNPLQVVHAPCGELKENERGSISLREILHNGQENFSENIWSCTFLGFWAIAKPVSKISPIVTRPSEMFNDCSTASEIRLRMATSGTPLKVSPCLTR